MSTDLIDSTTDGGALGTTATADSPAQATPKGKSVNNKAIADHLKERVAESKRQLTLKLPGWKRNVEVRIGNTSSLYTGGVNLESDDQSEINPDWALTKTKTANLYSQVPTVRLTHENKKYAPAVPPFAKALNYELGEKRVNLGVAMEEVLNDVVNAAGIGAIIVGFAARFETVDVPAIDTKMIDPAALPQLIALKQIPMTKGQKQVDYKFYGARISPSDLLTPSEFTGSNFDDGPWIGRKGVTTWSEGRSEFKLTEDQKEKVLSSNTASNDKNLRASDDKNAFDNESMRFTELYYWRHKYDPDCTSFKEIWKIVYVDGLDDPLVHEAWKGQQLDPTTRKYVGCCRFPIRVLTLTYITDNPIPPSDTAAGRPQVNDMRRSRSQMFQQRDRSIPIRWFDVNRIDPLLQDNLMRGTHQGMIPTNGEGSRSIGEIARASYPSEDLSFDQTTKADLLETWQIGPNQLGTTGHSGQTAAETDTTQTNFATRIGQERGRVASFFLSCVETLAGWMALYSDFPSLGDDERQAMQSAWDSKHILHDLAFNIRPDSQIVLDTSQRLDRLYKELNMLAKSGYLNVKAVAIEIAELTGVDPSEVIVDPQPPPPDEPNISYRFTGKDDLMNPFVIAMLIKLQKAPSTEELTQAKKLLLAAQLPPEPEPPAGASQPEAGGPGAPGPHPPGPGAQGSNEPPAPNPAPDSHPDWSLASKIASRDRDIAGGG